MTACALGVFILWFCWFGFNGASTVAMETAENAEIAGMAFMNTNLAAAVATVTAMLFTWIKYGKPDVSMTFNAALAGLVAITAPCDCVSPVGAFFIGLVAGFLVVLSVEFFDQKAKIDDPVGAVSVHMVNGIWGTIAVGLFSTGADGVGAGLLGEGQKARMGQVVILPGLPGQIPDPAGKQGFLFFVFHLYIFYMSLCLVCRAVPVSHPFGETAGMMYNRTVVLLKNAGCPQKGTHT